MPKERFGYLRRQALSRGGGLVTFMEYQRSRQRIVITQTVKDLVAGARFGLTERGTVELKGVPDLWTLFDVLEVDGEFRPQPIEGATVRPWYRP
jgi:hypothetical protein